MAEPSKFQVTLEEKGIRLDLFLSEKLGISRSQVKKMIDQGQVLMDGKRPKKAGDMLREGDVVSTQALKH